MKKRLFVLVMLLFTAGCMEPEAESDSQAQPPAMDIGEVSELKEEIIRLENTLLDTQETIEALEQMIMSHDGLGYGELRRNQQMVEDLIRHLPEIEIRTGFIQQVEDESMSIDFAEKIESPEAPNGFEIMNEIEEAESFPVTEGLTIFVLNGTDLEVRTLNEFDPSRHFLFEFYMSKGKIIQVREMYVP